MNIRIKVMCSEDALRTAAWPDALPVRPHIDEWISTKNGEHTRKIVRIEHSVYLSRVSNQHEYVMMIEVASAPRMKL